MFLLNWYAYLLLRAYTFKKRTPEYAEARSRHLVSWTIAVSCGVIFNYYAVQYHPYRDFISKYGFLALCCPLMVGIPIYYLISKILSPARYKILKEKYGESISVASARFVFSIMGIVYIIIWSALFLSSFN